MRSRARELKLSCVVERAQVKSYAREHRLSIEMAARRLRHDFLARAARKLGIRTIALAHHADDQVELFFVRLLRGAGGEGLAGMPGKSASPSDRGLILIRPLLDQPKSVLMEFARRAGVRFREDATNASLDILRNRVRHELIPLLREHYQPGLVRVIQRQAEIFSAESDFLVGQARRWLRRKDTEFESLPVALQRHCLRLQLLALGERAEFDLVEELRRAAGTPITLAPNTRVLRDQKGRVSKDISEPDVTSLEIKPVTIDLAERAETSFDGVKLSWKLVKAERPDYPRGRDGREWFDGDKIGQVIHLRHWRDGDRFQPSGTSKPVKLQDLFTNAKIPRAARRRLTVATTEAGDIWWVEGLRIGEKFKVTRFMRQRLEWKWKRFARL